MVKLTNVLILASGLCATAFSLERPVQRITGSNKIGASFSKAPTFQHSAPTYLKSAEDSRYLNSIPILSMTSIIAKLWNLYR